MPLSEIQRKIHPLAEGITWREWLATAPTKSPSKAEMQAWVERVRQEHEKAKKPQDRRKRR